MAIIRKNMKPKRTSSRTTGKAKVSTAVKKYVKRALLPIKPEVKRMVDYLAEDTLNTLATPYLQYEFLTAQGTALQNRIGTSVRLIGLHMKVFIKNNNNNTNFVRILILSTDGSTDITYATGEVFQDSNLAGAPTTISANTGLKLMTAEINKLKFKIHYDKVLKFANSNTTDSSDVKLFRHFHKFNSPIKYEANTYGLINQNRRYFIMYLGAEGPEDIVAGQTLEITGQHKWYFTDS